MNQGTLKGKPQIETFETPHSILGGRTKAFIDYCEEYHKSIGPVSSKSPGFIRDCLEDLAAHGYMPSRNFESGAFEFVALIKSKSQELFESEDHPEYGLSLRELRGKTTDELRAMARAGFVRLRD